MTNNDEFARKTSKAATTLADAMEEQFSGYNLATCMAACLLVTGKVLGQLPVRDAEHAMEEFPTTALAIAENERSFKPTLDVLRKVMGDK